MHNLVKSAAIAASIAGAAALGGCAEDRGYGYSSVSVGYNAAYGDPYWGWNGDYYYPGTGVYVYDRQRRRHNWNDGQRAYWQNRSSTWRGTGGRRSNWHEFRRGGGRRR